MKARYMKRETGDSAMAVSASRGLGSSLTVAVLAERAGAAFVRKTDSARFAVECEVRHILDPQHQNSLFLVILGPSALFTDGNPESRSWRCSPTKTGFHVPSPMNPAIAPGMTSALWS